MRASIVMKHSYVNSVIWVIPTGRGTICDGVSCYICKCTIYYPAPNLVEWSIYFLKTLGWKMNIWRGLSIINVPSLWAITLDVLTSTDFTCSYQPARPMSTTWLPSTTSVKSQRAWTQQQRQGCTLTCVRRFANWSLMGRLMHTPSDKCYGKTWSLSTPKGFQPLLRFPYPIKGTVLWRSTGHGIRVLVLD